MGDYILLFPVFFPIICGIFMPFVKNTRARNFFVAAVLLIELIVVYSIAFGPERQIEVWRISGMLSIAFANDGLSRIYACLIGSIWFVAAIFSFEYMKHETRVGRYFMFYTASVGVLMGISLSANFMTMYLFYEFMTLATVPLVLHTETHDAIAAGLKYLGYSIFGAGLGLIGFFFLCIYGDTTTFTAGGVLNPLTIVGHENFLRVVYLGMMIGFGCKAGMYPLHAWLPTAHPVAPAPASAVLSGIITKCGVLAIIRTTYYLFGVDFVRGTWVQNVILVLAICTVFMGSMLAYREKMLKKRLAYSSISQVSYVLFGLFLMTPQAFCGAILQIVAHAIAKNALFLSAGAVIYKTGHAYVDELKGIGKQMPVVLGCFTVASLSLVGIPPTGGFVSKWFLATGALECTVENLIPVIGIVVLIISALLTAGYLLTIVADAYFPGKDFDYVSLEKKEPNLLMLVPLIVLACGVVIVGTFPSGLIGLAENIAGSIF